MLTKLHQQRWNNAQRWAGKINRALAAGYLVLENGSLMKTPFTITEKEIFVKEGTTTWRYFEADPDYDHGLFETIKSWNDRHGVKFYSPVSEKDI